MNLAVIICLLFVIGLVWFIYFQGIAIILWVRAIYTNLLTSPRQRRFERLCRIYRREVGQNLETFDETEHPRIREISRWRSVNDLAESSEEPSDIEGSDYSDHFGLD